MSVNIDAAVRRFPSHLSGPQTNKSVTMRILLLHNYFHPEVGSAPHLMHELGETLVEFGHQVTVVTGFPRYNLAAMPDRYRRKLLYKEVIDGMTVLRINGPNYYGTGKMSRGLVQLLTPPVLLLRALPVKRPDVIHTLTPSIFMGTAARIAAARFRVPYVVSVQDLFPQCVVDAGVLHNRRLIRFFERVERSIYRHADAITVMSDGNRAHVLAKGASPDRTFTVPNWVDVDLIRPAERMNEFRRANGLGDEFIVLFAGTMGFVQSLDTVVEAARHLAEEPKVLFLMVGDGAERERLQKQAAGLSNVRFLPMQPQKKYPQVIAASDAALVTLRPEVATPTVPSKIASIMSAGRPILASIPAGGDAPRIIAEAKSGIVVPPAQPRALADAVMTLERDRRTAEQMGRNGRTYAETHLSRTACVAKVEAIMKRVVEA